MIHVNNTTLEKNVKLSASEMRSTTVLLKGKSSAIKISTERAAIRSVRIVLNILVTGRETRLALKIIILKKNVTNFVRK